MSLLFHRREIVRAVSGELPPDGEERLRVHLRGCSSCRDFYDQLSRTAEAASGATGSPTRAAARERARLEHALASPATQPAPAARSRRAWIAAGVVLAPAAALLLWVTRPAPETAPEVEWRGRPGDDAKPGPVLVVYAARRTSGAAHEPLRLVGEVPGSGTLRVSRADFIQFGVRGLATSAAVSVAVRSDAGVGRVFLPRAGTAAPIAPVGTEPATVGPSFDLAHGPPAGRYFLVARFDSVRPADAGVDSFDTPLGTLVIEP